MVFAAEALKGKKLLLLDGSTKSIEIIEHAHRLGLHVIVTDYNTPEQSPAKLAADEYFNVSSADVEAVVDLVRREGVSGIVTGFSDRWLPRYAEICEAAGLPCYATAEQIRLFTDKKRYKRLFEEFGVPAVEGFSVEEAESGTIPESSFPVMVKPADGSGSRGISVCHAPNELNESIRVAREYSWTDELIIERYMPGEEATAFWIFQDGEYHVSMIWNRHMYSFDGGEYRLPVAYSTPSYLVPEYLSSVAPKVRTMLKSVGIENGIMFMQGLVHDGVFRTYDIGYRVTPTQEYRIIEEICGYNPLMMLIHHAVTGTMGEPKLHELANPAHRGYGFNVSTLMHPGTVGAFEGLEEVRDLPGVLSTATAMVEGDTLPDEALGQLRQIVVRTIGVSDSPEELVSTVRRVVDLVDVVGQDGQPLVVDGTHPVDLEGTLLSESWEGAV